MEKAATSPRNRLVEIKRFGCYGWGLLVLATLSTTAATSQDFSAAEPPQLATPGQRLMMEQVQELIQAQEFEEAIANLEKLFDQGLSYVIAEGSVQRAGTIRTQRYVPLRSWTQQQLLKILGTQPVVREAYYAKVAEVARARFDEVTRSKVVAEARQAAERFSASPLGPALQLLLADLYLERGWSLAAIQAAQQASNVLRIKADPDNSQQGTIPYPLVSSKLRDSATREALLARLENDLRIVTESDREPKELLAAGLQRMLFAAVLEPDVVDKTAVVQWVSIVAKRVLKDSLQSDLLQSLQACSSWQDDNKTDVPWLTFAGNNSRNQTQTSSINPSQWPKWTGSLERFTATSDRTAASKPRVGESERGTLPYFPALARGKVFINELTRIIAYDLETGKPWPDIRPALPLYDRQIDAAAFFPLGYPLVGSPRGTLSICDNSLYARMGVAVSGWANGERAPDGGSISSLIGLDLNRQGSMLRGFPLRLTPPEFTGMEFEGTPVVWGDMIMAPIAERDNVGLRRRVAAFDRFNGQLKWQSDALASGAVEGTDRANLITHQLLSVAGGRIFYNTNLGSIVCLDPLTGRIEWLTRYKRAMKQRRAYALPDRFRYRDLTPCLISGGLVYCAPQDCPEVFALDATTGDLIWSTDESVADVIHLLGVHQDSLVVSGDRIVWIDRRSGKQLARFPSANTPGVVNALPSPRGLGRGLISGGNVYWPTSREIFVFPASIDHKNQQAVEGNIPFDTAPVPILRRISIDARGSEGGNLVVYRNWLLFLSPSRILAFEPNPSPKISRVSATDIFQYQTD